MPSREEITGYLRTETGEEYHARHKRQEIREEVALNILKACPSMLIKDITTLTDKILKDEDSQGVVIEVVPDDSPQIFRAVEPLIEKEATNG